MIDVQKIALCLCNLGQVLVNAVTAEVDFAAMNFTGYPTSSERFTRTEFFTIARTRELSRWEETLFSHIPPAPTARLFSVCVKCRQFGRNKSSLELSRSGMVLRYLFARGSKATTTSNRLPLDFSM